MPSNTALYNPVSTCQATLLYTIQCQHAKQHCSMQSSVNMPSNTALCNPVSTCHATLLYTIQCQHAKQHCSIQSSVNMPSNTALYNPVSTCHATLLYTIQCYLRENAPPPPPTPRNRALGSPFWIKNNEYLFIAHCIEFDLPFQKTPVTYAAGVGSTETNPPLPIQKASQEDGSRFETISEGQDHLGHR